MAIKKKIDKVSPKVKAALVRKKAVAKDNRLFEKMTPAEKRVQIARDVLIQIELGKFIPVNGTWLTNAESENESLFTINDVKKNPELQEIINSTETCVGCALGSLFYCAIKRADNLKLSELEVVKMAKKNAKHYNSSIEEFLPTEETAPYLKDILKYMKKFFSNKQLAFIEIAFEDGGGGMSSDNFDPDCTVRNFFYCDETGELIEEPAERLRLIMENIIVNKGRFVPSQKPVLVSKYITTNYIN